MEIHFQHCCNLKELFVRKNKIAALSEVFSEILSENFSDGWENEALIIGALAATFAQTFEPDDVGESLFGGELGLQTHRWLNAHTQTHRHTDTGLTIDLHTFSSAHAAAIEEVGQRGGDLEANSLNFLSSKNQLCPSSVFYQYCAGMPDIAQSKAIKSWPGKIIDR